MAISECYRRPTYDRELESFSGGGRPALADAQDVQSLAAEFHL